MAGFLVGLAGGAWAAGLEHARAALEAENKRDFDAAIDLYTKAIEAGDLSKENLADVRAYRGNAQFFLGRFAEAASDYEESLKINPRVIYPAFWLYIARARSGQDGKAELTKNAARLKDLFYWPGPIAALFLGKATPKEVVAGAEDPFLDARRQREQQCEAHFYVGQFHLLNGRKAEAAAAFKKA
ncbi:MAG: tetratricopeptide repeat protein, partial [Alphaproteobacteria bacterium]